VEVKIGVADSPRELTVSTGDSPDRIQAIVTDALRNTQGLLTLVDDKSDPQTAGAWASRSAADPASLAGATQCDSTERGSRPALGCRMCRGCS
jgi:hypothetical protein